VHLAEPNLDAAVAVIVAAPADLVITRILPGTFGIRLVETLKRQPATCGMPLVVLTTYISRNIADQARRAGADEVLLLPHDVRHLLALAWRLTSRRS
jgi:DNA-binding response OmpR family regulator